MQEPLLLATVATGWPHVGRGGCLRHNSKAAVSVIATLAAQIKAFESVLSDRLTGFR